MPQSKLIYGRLQIWERIDIGLGKEAIFDTRVTVSRSEKDRDRTTVSNNGYNTQSRTVFRLLPQSMTLDDLERSLCITARQQHEHTATTFLAHRITMDPRYQQQKMLPRDFSF